MCIRFCKAPALNGNKQYCYLVFAAGYGFLTGRYFCDSSNVEEEHYLRNRDDIGDSHISTFEVSDRQFDVLKDLKMYPKIGK